MSRGGFGGGRGGAIATAGRLSAVRPTRAPSAATGTRGWRWFQTGIGPWYYGPAMPAPALRYARENRDRFLRELIEFLRFPSVSAQPDVHCGDSRACAAWLAGQLR